MSSPPEVTRPRPTWQQSLPAPFNAIPVEVLTICGLLAAAGVLTLWPAVRVLPDIFDLLGSGGIFRDLGLLLLTVWVVLALFGVGALVLAWRLAHADRVARGLTYVLCGGLGGSILLGDEQTTALVLVMLASFATIGILVAVPRVQAFFAGDGAPQGDMPVPIVIARTLVAIWAALVVLVGAMFLPLGGLGSKFVFVGVVLLVLGIGAFRLNGQLAAGDPVARNVVSAGGCVYAFLLVVLGRRDPGLLLPLSLAAGVLWNLWMPAEAQRHFAPAEAVEAA